MTSRPLLLLAAALTAALGAVALVTGSGAVAAAAGLAAIVAASLVLNHSGAAMPARAAGGGVERDAGTDADLHLAGVTRASVGMLDEASLLSALRSRTEVARRTHRPLSVVHLDVLDVDAGGGTRGGRDLDGGILDSTLRESDLYGRRRDGVHVFVLEDTGEDGAVWTAERLRRRLAADGGPRRYFAGIATFPAHALDARSLDAKAAAALDAAREWQQDRIEVATGA